MMGPRPKCYIPSHKVIGPLVLEKIFEGFFYHIWAWRSSWPCDPDPANKLSFPYPTEAPHKIWLRLAQRFWRRTSLKMVDGRTTYNGRQRTTTHNGRTTEHAYTISSTMRLKVQVSYKKDVYKYPCYKLMCVLKITTSTFISYKDRRYYENDFLIKTLHKWTASSEFGSYRLCEQRRFRRACASAQSRQNLRCSLIQAVNQEEPSDRNPDPWPL